MEAIRSCETSVHTKTKQPHIPENCILHNHRCEDLKSYMDLTFNMLSVVCDYSLDGRMINERVVKDFKKTILT
jgi:hypothetical protein